VLLSLVEQIVHGDADPRFQTLTVHHPIHRETAVQDEGDSDAVLKRRLIRKLRVQVCYCSMNG
jgi:high-affinity iron transporter